MKNTLAAVTPVGTFTRSTATPYTHIVVWNSPRAMNVYTSASCGSNSGVYARWCKDKGFSVTWHGSEAAAKKAAQSGNKWDGASTLAGIFNVTKCNATRDEIQAEYAAVLKQTNAFTACKCGGVKHTCKNSAEKNRLIQQAHDLAVQLND